MNGIDRLLRFAHAGNVYAFVVHNKRLQKPRSHIVILIVEPDAELAGAMGEMLADDGFEVCIADSLNYAVGRLPGKTVQGVVIDVDGIPLYSDHTALKVMGEWFRHCDTPPPLIVLSICVPSRSDGGLPPSSLSRALWIEWVNKPFQNKAFLSLIRQTVRPN